jgi:hypothetical protein
LRRSVAQGVHDQCACQRRDGAEGAVPRTSASPSDANVLHQVLRDLKRRGLALSCSQ